MDTNKVLTILEVRDLLFPALQSNLAQINKLDKDTAQFSDNASRNLGGAARSISTGWAGIAALGTAAIATIQQATQKAIDFNAQFRELRNLNLDKSAAQLGGLRDQVLDTALAAGRGAIDMNRAFFDIQSGTGKFGDEVAAIATTTSDFSRAFSIDFNTTLEGGIRGMKNFNLGASELEDFYGSMVKTVQVGIVTFEQLARVQVDYAGAAAAAGQSVDSANKLFAVFTTRAKSAEEAATLTKSAFTDLLRPSTLETFGKLGIDVFDSTTGRVRQLDDIVGQLSERFAGAQGDDRALTGLINQFSGSEGLTALISEAARNGGAMLDTFRQFDGTEFRLGDALRAANADADVLADVARNKLDVILTKIGSQTLPIWVNLLGYISNDILPAITRAMPAIESALGRMGNALKLTVGQLSDAVSWIGSKLDTYNSAADRRREAIDLSNRFGRQQMDERLQGGRLGRLGLDDERLDAMTPQSRYILSNHIQGLYSKGGDINTEAATKLLGELRGRGEDRTSTASWQLVTELTRQMQEQRPRDLEAQQKTNNALGAQGQNIIDATLSRMRSDTAAAAGGGTTDFSRSSGRGASLGAIQGGAGVRHVTINIQRQVGIETLVTNNLPTSMSDLEAMLRTLITRAVRDAEIAIQ